MNAEEMNPSPREMDGLGKSRVRTSRKKSSLAAAAAERAKIPPQSIENTCRKRKISCRRQKLLTSQYILAKVFRKDGPSLGSQFDHLPSSRSKGTVCMFPMVYLFIYFDSYLPGLGILSFFFIIC